MHLSAVDLVLRVSAKSEGACELPAGSNGGPYVERVLRRVGLTRGQPWCAAEVADTGTIALGALWPLPLTGGCEALHAFAVAHRCLVSDPDRGDVFLLWHPELKRFGHTGFCATPNPDGSWTTHDGNTTQQGTTGQASREGWLKAIKTRRFTQNDRFIRWTALLASDLL